MPGFRRCRWQSANSRRDLGPQWLTLVAQVFDRHQPLPPQKLPSLLIGVGMVLVGIGLLFRSRVAWTMALLLGLAAATGTVLGHTHVEIRLLGYFAAIIATLAVSWRRFDRASLAASTLFAITSIMMLLMYATFGAFYLGAQFKPPVADLVTALYYAIVTMSTVGFGDITPQTADARLFTISVIVLGVAVFATSLTAVVAPLVSNSLNRIVSSKGKRMQRSNHFVVIGNTVLAVNTWRELSKRGRAVTRILDRASDNAARADADVVVGDGSNLDVLREAGAHQAECVLAMTADDSDNAFIVLAVKELGGKVRTVAAVNDSSHMGRIKLVQPDMVIAPQVLGGELMAMMLSGETVTPDFVMNRVFHSQEGR